MKTHLLSLTPTEFCDATHACPEGRRFAVKYKTMSAVWRACKRVDWLVWILNAIDAEPDEKACRLYMVWCARNTPLADGRTTAALLTDPRSVAALQVGKLPPALPATAPTLCARLRPLVLAASCSSSGTTNSPARMFGRPTQSW